MPSKTKKDDKNKKSYTINYDKNIDEFENGGELHSKSSDKEKRKAEKKAEAEQLKNRKKEVKQAKKEKKALKKLLDKQYAREAREDRKANRGKKNKPALKTQKPKDEYLDYEQLFENGFNMPDDSLTLNDAFSNDEDEPIKKKKSKKGLVISIILLAFIAAAALCFAGIIDLSRAFDGIQNLFTGVGGNYPADISRYNMSNMYPFDGNLLMLTDTDLVLYSKKGDKQFEKHHGYDSPTLKTAGQYALTYETFGAGVRLDTKSKTVFDKKAANKIISADVSRSGKIALVTEDDGYNAVLRLYDSSFKQESFKWYSAKNNAVDVSISDNGRYAAVITMSAKNGKIVSHLVLLDFDKSKPIATIDYNNSMLFSVCFKTNSDIAVIGDNICSLVQINSPDKHSDYKFEDSKLLSYSNDKSSENVLLALNQHSDLSSTKIIMLSSGGKTVFEKEVSGEAVDLSLDSKTPAVLTNSKVYVLDSNGNEIRDYKSSNEYRRIVNFGTQCYIASNSSIDFCENNS